MLINVNNMLKCRAWNKKVSPQLSNRQEKDSFPSKTVTLQDVLLRYVYIKMLMISRHVREDAKGQPHPSPLQSLEAVGNG